MNRRIRNVAKDAMRIWSCGADSLRGCSVHEILSMLEREGGHIVFWGLFSDDELAYIYPIKET
jgi:hypothetical protein